MLGAMAAQAICGPATSATLTCLGGAQMGDVPGVDVAGISPEDLASSSGPTSNAAHIRGFEGNDVIFGGNGVDSIAGGWGSDDDALRGGDGDDELRGGDEVLTGGLVADRLTGDAGADGLVHLDASRSDLTDVTPVSSRVRTRSTSPPSTRTA